MSRYFIIYDSLREESSVKSSLDIEIEEIRFDPKLYVELKDLRAKLAKEQGVAAYLGFRKYPPHLGKWSKSIGLGLLPRR